MTDNDNQDTTRENGESDISKEVSTALEDVIQNSDEDLGIAGRLAKSFIHSPLSPLFYFALLG
ncbi:MAG: hypothetical protein KAJ95_02630, partial [Gammaproteobacteria bacterium]|nr:hypothetical protein [Gammaproteobacteria bacterium]